jgi:hypothetical protein
MATATCTAPPSSRAAGKDTGRPLGRREDRIGGPTVRAALARGRARFPGAGEPCSVSRFGFQEGFESGEVLPIRASHGESHDRTQELERS